MVGFPPGDSTIPAHEASASPGPLLAAGRRATGRRAVSPRTMPCTTRAARAAASSRCSRNSSPSWAHISLMHRNKTNGMPCTCTCTNCAMTADSTSTEATEAKASRSRRARPSVTKTRSSRRSRPAPGRRCRLRVRTRATDRPVRNPSAGPAPSRGPSRRRCG